MPTCPLHAVPMIYVGRVPAWENRRLHAHAWHCPQCTIELQFPVATESTEPQTPPTK